MRYCFPRQFILVRKKIAMRVALMLVCMLAVSVYFKEVSWVVSAVLGACFGYLIFTQLVYSQWKILMHQRKELFLVGYIVRLFMYGIPLTTTFFLKSYLNLYVLLVFLLSFQLQYVGIEFFRNLKKYKRRLSNGSIR